MPHSTGGTLDTFPYWWSSGKESLISSRFRDIAL